MTLPRQLDRPFYHISRTRPTGKIKATGREGLMLKDIFTLGLEDDFAGGEYLPTVRKLLRPSSGGCRIKKLRPSSFELGLFLTSHCFIFLLLMQKAGPKPPGFFVLHPLLCLMAGAPAAEPSRTILLQWRRERR